MSRSHRCDPHRATIREMIAEGKTARQVSEAIGVARSQVIKFAATRALGAWSSTPDKGTIASRQVPKDFEANWHIMSNTELAAHYRRAGSTIGAWCLKKGLKREVSPQAPKSRPTDFIQHAGKTLAEISAHYGCGRDVAARWRREIGFSRKPRIAPVSAPLFAPSLVTQSAIRVNRDMSVAGQAADFLRRLGPVSRCTEAGTPDPTGTHWRRGNSIPLTGEEIIERAKHKGWDPDAWKRVRAA